MTGHRIEEAVKVYLVLSDDGTRWDIDQITLDGEPLDSAYDTTGPLNGDCGCGATVDCDDALDAALQIPLPTGQELAALLMEALA